MSGRPQHRWAILTANHIQFRADLGEQVSPDTNTRDARQGLDYLFVGKDRQALRELRVSNKPIC